MKNLLLILLAATGITAFTVADSLPIGSEMPMADHKMLDVSGVKVSMKDQVKENGVLVMFSCNTCPYVLKNQQRTINIANFATKMGYGVILLNSNEAQRKSDDSFGEMKLYAKQQPYYWNYVIDQDHRVADAFGAKRTPECFLFDKNLKLVYHGAIDDNPSDETAVSLTHLRNAIDQAARGKEVTVKETRSVGCTIKRNK